MFPGHVRYVNSSRLLVFIWKADLIFRTFSCNNLTCTQSYVWQKNLKGVIKGTGYLCSCDDCDKSKVNILYYFSDSLGKSTNEFSI